jgi:hypothetical protein
MSKKGVLPPLLLNRDAATLVAALMLERLEGAELVGTEFDGAEAFGRMLRRSVNRRSHAGKSVIAVYNVPPTVARAAVNYLMLYYRHEASRFVSIDQGEALSDVAATVDLALLTREDGPRCPPRRPLSLEDIEARLRGFESEGAEGVAIEDERHYRRLKQRRQAMVDQKRFWESALANSDESLRTTVPVFMRPYLVPRRNTEQ